LRHREYGLSHLQSPLHSIRGHNAGREPKNDSVQDRLKSSARPSDELTSLFNFSPIEGIDVLPHGGSERMMRAAPSPLGQVLLVRIVTSKQGKFSNPKEMWVCRYNKITLVKEEVKLQPLSDSCQRCRVPGRLTSTLRKLEDLETLSAESCRPTLVQSKQEVSQLGAETYRKNPGSGIQPQLIANLQFQGFVHGCLFCVTHVRIYLGSCHALEKPCLAILFRKGYVLLSVNGFFVVVLSAPYHFRGWKNVPC